MADIPFCCDPDQELYDQFYKACRALSFFDTVVLARTLGVNVRTVRNWKAGKTFPPRRGLATLVIQWVTNGKPVKTMTQAEIANSMF